MHHKRLAIDVRLWNQGGVGRYIRNLVKELSVLKPDASITLIARPEEAAQVAAIAPSFHLLTSPARWHTYSEQTSLLRQLYSYRFDLVHFPYVSHPVLYQKPFVITIHDITMFTHATGAASTRSQMYYFLKQKAYGMVLSHGLHASKTIMVPTHTVEQELMQAFAVSKERIAVTYEGVDADLAQVKAVKTFVPAKDFYLYVGNCYPHKNIELLLRLAQSAQHPFVLVAPDDIFTDRMLVRAQELGVEKKISVVRKVEDSVLKYLYQHARALIFPSFKEGFGLPIIEAAYFNCPLAVSDIPSFREIAPQGTIFFDPHTCQKAQRALDALPTRIHTSYPQSYMAQFSFAAMAKQTLQV
ncbi:MAG: glycosyltransferase family 4 protein, partial [Candidatus Roizmanbacteria bacterium]|nr:glycosyltransferase family 4 protein [Candidatus Roizmanbacteria bacterium]